MAESSRDFSGFVLGETSEKLMIDTREDMYQATLNMVRQARRHIFIFSHQLDKAIYDTEAIYEAMKDFAIASPHTHIRVLVQDVRPMTEQGHRLLNLSRHLSSHSEIRLAHRQHRDQFENWLLVDDRGLVIRENPNRYEAEVCYNDPLRCTKLSEQFINMWEHSTVDTALRQLSL